MFLRCLGELTGVPTIPKMGQGGVLWSPVGFLRGPCRWYPGGLPGRPRGPQMFPERPAVSLGGARDAWAMPPGRHGSSQGIRRSRGLCGLHGHAQMYLVQCITHSTGRRAKRSARDSARIVSSIYIYIYTSVDPIQYLDRALWVYE